MTKRAWLELAAIAALVGVAAIASASETINYTYDAKGRLVKVVRTGTVNDANGGPGSSSNYNKIESPGKKYRDEDGVD